MGKSVRTIIGDQEVNLPARYNPIEPIGQGAYGLVFSASLTSEDNTVRNVAVKKISNIFKDMPSIRRVLREAVILKQLVHENIIHLEEIIVPTDNEFREIYIITDLMETDLGSVLKSDQKLSHDQIKLLLYQLVRGLKYIHSSGLFHRDLKPRNLLINANCDLKICDFGLSRMEVPDPRLTDYVCTRWYRAPELLVSAYPYSNKIDMFSTGCILAEMVNHRALFAGNNTQQQLDLIIKRIGPLSEDELESIPKGFYRRYCLMVSRANVQGGDLAVFMGPDVSTEVVDMVKSLIRFDPKDRVNACELLCNPFFGDLRMTDDEPVSTKRLNKSLFPFEKYLIDRVTVRQIITGISSEGSFKTTADDIWKERLVKEETIPEYVPRNTKVGGGQINNTS